MKRAKDIYDSISDLENIEAAIVNASIKKRHRPGVDKIFKDKEFYAQKIESILKSESYTASSYTIKEIIDNSSFKRRIIHVPRFYPDQIIHWALIQRIHPLFLKGMYHYSCGAIPGRGQVYGARAVRKWLDSDRKNTKYCLKMDISKFYQNVDHNCLKEMIRRIIKDQKTLALIDEIINSTESGLPIGNYTSQWFANFYLQGLDYFIKQKLNVRYYVRYVDDLVLLGPNKKKLHKAKLEIESYVKNLNLTIKGDWQVFPISARPIDFLGYKFFRTHTTMRRKIALRIMRKSRKILKEGKYKLKDCASMMSYLGHVKHSDSYKFKEKYIAPLDLNKMKEVISIESRKQHQTQKGSP